jgi:MFS family permease
MRFRGPLADAYPGAVVLVLLALTPYLMLSTAIAPLDSLFQQDLGLSETATQVITGLANAAYAFGAVGALQLTVRLPVRRLLLVFASGFVAASALAAWAPTSGSFAAGRVLQGLLTGAMLIAAVPPLVIGNPREKLPFTAVVMNLGIFGAVALGPVIGGAFAGAEAWRPLFWAVTGLGLLALLFAVLTYEDQEPQAPDAPIDLVAMVLAGGGCAAAFFGASYLTGHRLLSAAVIVPLLAGVAMIAALLAWEHGTPDPLMPVQRLASTFPLCGILVAMVAGAGSVAFVELAQTALEARKAAPGHAGVLFVPEFAAALLAAAAFGRLFFTRWVPALAFGGLFVLAGGGIVLTGAARGGDALVLVGSALVGLGVGASVSPALFVAGWSLPSGELPRVFAMVELLRGVAAFLVGPLLLHLAQTAGGSPAGGLRTATWVMVGLVLAGAALVAAVFVAGRGGLQRPDIDTWLEQDGPALRSPALAEAVR